MPTPGQHRYYLMLRRPEDIEGLARVAASLFPEPDDAFTGIYELLVNAIEHGNLGIGYEDKFALVSGGNWQGEIDRRLSLPEYQDKTVEIEVVEEKDSVHCTVIDQGSGFDWQHYMRQTPDHRRPHGRGIWLARQCAFDTIRFNKTGNAVTCTRKRPQPTLASQAS